MRCNDIETDLPLYSDGSLGETASETVRAHLASCPVCRARHAEMLEVRSGLRRLDRAVLSDAVRRRIVTSVVTERRRSENSWVNVTPDIREWMTRGLMPYAVGVCASVVLAFSFLTLLSSGIRQRSQTADSAPTMIASNRNPFRDDLELSPAEYARTRLDVAPESPSINPNGALVALTKSLVRGRMKDDEVVVVADVFGNGLAQITQVVEPSRDQKAVMELQKALYTDPSYAPFVPSTLDNRSDTVQVVLRLQSVDVKTSTARARK